MKKSSIDPTKRFSNRVENYIKYRPDYPAAVFAFLKATANLQSTDKVADVGSGTGIFAKHFLEASHTVYGIEPNPKMREASVNLLTDHPNFRAIDGSASQTTLPNKSVQLITAAQAFHWFDPQKCRIEFKRILKKGGHVALIWNTRLTNTTPFAEAYENLLIKYATDYHVVDHRKTDEKQVDNFFANGKMQRRTFPNNQFFNNEGVKGRLLSSSYAPPPDHPKYFPMLEHLENIFEAHQTENQISFEYKTEVYLGKIS